MATRDVVWITLESVRADHTSLGPHVRETTPTLEDLAARGQGSMQCFAHDIWTRPASASILTGRASSAHRTWSNDASLPEEIRTVPEAFREAGYRTACVSPNGQLSSSTGLDCGFDRFHFLRKSTLLSEAGPVALARWLAGFRRHAGGLIRDGSQHCIGYLLTRIARREISEAADNDDPLFLYLHHGDSHHAYVPPVAWRDHFGDDLPVPPDEAVDVALEMSDRLHEHIAEGTRFSDKEWQALRVCYDTTIAYVDHLVGRLLDHARAELSDPIVVVTSDHGELFGERGVLAHMLLANDAVSRVPLVVDGLEGSFSGLVQHADVMAMLCADLGIDHPVPVGRDVREDPRSVAVTQRSGARARAKLDIISDANPQFPADRFHTGDLTSLRTTDWRYQSSGDRFDLYDPSEASTDVAADHPDVAGALADRLDSWLATHGRPVGDTGTAEFDAGTQAQLQDLGYLQ